MGGGGETDGHGRAVGGTRTTVAARVIEGWGHRMRVGALIGRVALVLAVGLSTGACASATIPSGSGDNSQSAPTSDTGQTTSESTDFGTEVSSDNSAGVPTVDGTDAQTDAQSDSQVANQSDFTTDFGTDDSSTGAGSDFTSGFDSLDQSQLSSLSAFSS